MPLDHTWETQVLCLRDSMCESTLGWALSSSWGSSPPLMLLSAESSHQSTKSHVSPAPQILSSWAACQAHHTVPEVILGKVR